MSETTIQILATIGECSNYMPTIDHKEKITVSIVIAPLKVQGNPDKMKFSEGCNMFEGCFNPDCYYSVAARTKNGKTR